MEVQNLRKPRRHKNCGNHFFYCAFFNKQTLRVNIYLFFKILRYFKFTSEDANVENIVISFKILHNYE